jgi:NitT/TauT family transport system permease protein
MASNQGIGMLIVQASSNLRISLVFAALTVIAAMSVAMYAAFAVIEARMTGWVTRRADFAIGG